MTIQLITIPISSSLSLEDLLEVVQAMTEDLQNSIEDAGAACEIDELDVSVQYTGE
tara:strand:+ start:38 stop:205 length:168 start_codon:yes stop_codon:yes gene_type:complete